MVEVGQKAPDFTLLSDEAKKVTLSQEIGKGPIVLSFYVFDFSSVCTGQLCGLRDEFGELQKFGAKVFGISADSHWSHRAFRAAQHLQYPLLSDWNKTVSKGYGVLCDKFGDYLGVTKRSVFVLDKDSIVRYKWVTEDAKVPPDVKAVAREVAKLAGSRLGG